MFRSPGPVAIQIGPLSIRWYGILMALAMAVGLWLAYRDARRRGLDPENLLKASGRGIFFMRSFMDDVTLRRGTEGGMEVRMVKKLASGG